MKTAVCSYADGTRNGAEEQPVMFLHRMGMRRGAAATRSCRHRRGKQTEGRGRTERREAYQSDHGGSGSGARDDVQVVGQVELEGAEQQWLWLNDGREFPL